jgi:hypothetical protein
LVVTVLFVLLFERRLPKLGRQLGRFVLTGDPKHLRARGVEYWTLLVFAVLLLAIVIWSFGKR